MPDLDLDKIDWLIVGGESGRSFRNMDPAWSQDLRDRIRRCRRAIFLQAKLRPPHRDRHAA